MCKPGIPVQWKGGCHLFDRSVSIWNWALFFQSYEEQITLWNTLYFICLRMQGQTPNSSACLFCMSWGSRISSVSSSSLQQLLCFYLMALLRVSQEKERPVYEVLHMLQVDQNGRTKDWWAAVRYQEKNISFHQQSMDLGGREIPYTSTEVPQMFVVFFTETQLLNWHAILIIGLQLFPVTTNFSE